MIILIIKIFVSIYIMWKVSSSFDLAASFLTKKMGEGIKGPTINAVASSLPELIISSMFLFYFGDIVGFSAGYATIIGSSAFNIACIPVFSFLVVYFSDNKIEFKIDKSIVSQDGLFLLLSIILLSSGFVIGINQYLSLMLIILYCIYVYCVYNKRKNIPTDVNKQTKILNENFNNGKVSYLNSLINLKIYNIFNLKKLNVTNSWAVILISVILIGSSCWLLIEAVETISITYGLNLFISAFFIAAIASSVPDTILSIKDAKNEKFTDSFSNSYGSNIFDICIGIGLPVLVYSIIYQPIPMNIPIDRMGISSLGDYFLEGNLLLWSIVLLFIFTFIISAIYYFGKINLRNSMIILLLYLTFIIGLIIY
tara:strand:- start:226 stop:1329 length:1104 start_codon:yes stop_codon:yes gene_type:complete